jgi:hypothetical protein
VHGSSTVGMDIGESNDFMMCRKKRIDMANMFHYSQPFDYIH